MNVTHGLAHQHQAWQSEWPKNYLINLTSPGSFTSLGIETGLKVKKYVPSKRSHVHVFKWLHYDNACLKEGAGTGSLCSGQKSSGRSTATHSVSDCTAGCLLNLNFITNYIPVVQQTISILTHLGSKLPIHCTSAVHVVFVVDRLEPGRFSLST